MRLRSAVDGIRACRHETAHGYGFVQATDRDLSPQGTARKHGLIYEPVPRRRFLSPVGNRQRAFGLILWCVGGDARAQKQIPHRTPEPRASSSGSRSGRS